MWNTRALPVAACAVALLCGCASYRPAPLSPADNARALESRSLQDPRLGRFIRGALDHTAQSADAARWQLTTLTLAALYFHPDIRIAQARLAGAEAAVITAREPPNPTLHLSNVVAQAAVAGAIPPAALPITVGPVIDFILETAGKRQARTARAERLADAARWDLATAQWQVRGAVRDALLAVWASDQRLDLARQRLGLQQALVQLMQRRLTAGALSAPEVAREQIRYAQDALAISTLEQAVADARVRLATAIGIPVRALNGVALTLDAFSHPPVIGDLADWRHRALTSRSDVQAGLADYQAAQNAVRLAVAGQYPDLTFGPGYNYDLGVNRYILDVGATLPVLHRNQGQIAEALARRREAAASFTKVQARAIAAIDQAETDVRISTRGVMAADSVLAEEKHAAQQVESAFKVGQADRPALLSARLVVVTTELARFDAVVQQRQAVGALEDGLQRPLYEPAGGAGALPTMEPAQ